MGTFHTFLSTAADPGHIYPPHLTFTGTDKWRSLSVTIESC
jgi:hypothetical protein